MSKEKVKQYVFLTILMSVINFCVAGVLVGTTVINLKGAEAAEENIQQLNQQIAVINPISRIITGILLQLMPVISS